MNLFIVHVLSVLISVVGVVILNEERNNIFKLRVFSHSLNFYDELLTPLINSINLTLVFTHDKSSSENNLSPSPPSENISSPKWVSKRYKSMGLFLRFCGIFLKKLLLCCIKQTLSNSSRQIYVNTSEKVFCDLLKMAEHSFQSLD